MNNLDVFTVFVTFLSKAKIVKLSCSKCLPLYCLGLKEVPSNNILL